MKNLLLLLTITLTLSCCNNDDKQPTNPIDQLPPATQVGANTFGCLLDGEVFKPGNGPNPLDCVYQFVDGEYYFTLQANKRDENNNLLGIALATQKLQIIEGNTYQLQENIDGNFFAIYTYGTFQNFTNQINSGEIKITKLDIPNQIVSGTFWFDVQDSNGIIRQIREGRFDVTFTQ